MTSLALASLKKSCQVEIRLLKGSMLDHCVIDVNDVKAIPQLQADYSLPAKPAKLVQDGSEIDFGCNVLPTGDKE